MPTISASALEAFVLTTLRSAGLTEDEAAHCASASMFADLRGTDTHGVSYIIPRTLESIAQGKTIPGASLETVRDSGAVALLKGNGLAGPAFGYQAMHLAMDKAETYGIGLVCTYAGNPLGLLGYYPSLALDRGLIGLAMANTSPAVAPHGAISRVFGTNPFAYAAPAQDEVPVIFDIATSIAASGKLGQARRRGESLPEGWVIDGNGDSITNPHQADSGALLPFGAHKGSGIALLVHLLTGALSGTTVGGESTHNNPDESIRGQSTMFLAIDPGHFTSRDDYRGIVDRQIRNVHSATPVPGAERVLMPGERGWQEYERRKAHGIPIQDDDWDAVLKAVERAGLPVDDIARTAGATR